MVGNLKRPNAISILVAGIALLSTSVVQPLAADEVDGLSGKAILQKDCSRCHSIEATGDSPLAVAPPLRDIYRKRSLERLEFELAEGMGSRHQEMPQVQFSTEEIAAILNYLNGIATTN